MCKELRIIDKYIYVFSAGIKRELAAAKKKVEFMYSY